jgi:hypothetical protein
MNMEERKTSVMNRVQPVRRDFFKTLMAGTTLVAPLVTNFGINALTAKSAYGQTGCGPALGYVGPRSFAAHVSLVSFGGPGPQFPNKPNGQMTLFANVVGETVTSIFGRIKTVSSVKVQSVNILLANSPATQGIVLTGNNFTLTAANLNTAVVCDLDELCDQLASPAAVAKFDGTFQMSPATLEGLIVPVLSAGGED